MKKLVTTILPMTIALASVFSSCSRKLIDPYKFKIEDSPVKSTPFLVYNTLRGTYEEAYFSDAEQGSDLVDVDLDEESYDGRHLCLSFVSDSSGFDRDQVKKAMTDFLTDKKDMPTIESLYGSDHDRAGGDVIDIKVSKRKAPLTYSQEDRFYDGPGSLDCSSSTLLVTIEHHADPSSGVVEFQFVSYDVKGMRKRLDKSVRYSFAGEIDLEKIGDIMDALVDFSENHSKNLSNKKMKDVIEGFVNKEYFPLLEAY